MDIELEIFVLSFPTLLAIALTIVVRKLLKRIKEQEAKIKSIQESDQKLINTLEQRLETKDELLNTKEEIIEALKNKLD
jgi:hypothetical protein